MKLEGGAYPMEPAGSTFNSFKDETYPSSLETVKNVIAFNSFEDETYQTKLPHGRGKCSFQFLWGWNCKRRDIASRWLKDTFNSFEDETSGNRTPWSYTNSCFQFLWGWNVKNSTTNYWLYSTFNSFEDETKDGKVEINEWNGFQFLWGWNGAHTFFMFTGQA